MGNEPLDACLSNLNKFDILTTPLEKTTEICNVTLNWADGFLRSNLEINENNLPEYSALWNDLNLIHRSAIHMSGEDPKNYLPGDRDDIKRKRNYAERLQKLISSKKALLRSIGRERIKGTLLDGSYEYLNPHTAEADY